MTRWRSSTVTQGSPEYYAPRAVSFHRRSDRQAVLRDFVAVAGRDHRLADGSFRPVGRFAPRRYGGVRVPLQHGCVKPRNPRVLPLGFYQGSRTVAVYLRQLNSYRLGATDA